MSSSKPNNIKAMSWDPKSPHALLLPQIEQGKPTAVDTFLSHAGTGCNSHELAALMKILQAHEQYYNSGTGEHESSNNATAASTNHLSLKQLSQEYRNALCDCLAGWEMEETEDETMGNTNNGSSGNANGGALSMSIDILRAMYSVMHLSDIFLPLGMPSTSSQSHLDYSYLQDPFDTPGYATADTVRYLRYNQISEPEAIDPDGIAEMLDSMQPEEFDGGALYWKYLTSLVLSGCLEKAWSVLSRHSLFMTAMNSTSNSNEVEDTYYAASMEETRQGFRDLMEFFLRAPLPGGRNSDYDDVMGTPDYQEEDYDEGGHVNVDSYLLEGLDVAGQDYKFWESGDASSASNSAARASADYPTLYSPDAAIRKHRQWREYVRERRMSFSLTRRIPEIDALLAILAGDFSGAVVFESWAERLLAELLYRQPDLRPKHLSARTRKIIKDTTGEDASKNGILVAITSIMDGNAGQAIEAMYLLGGGSGAALPSTLLALLYDLLSEANHIPSNYASRKIECLCEASAAILSSLADSNPGVGTRLAVRLLLPYAAQKGNTPIVATITDILDHHAPQTDAEARSLLTLCRPLVEQKSVRVLDGCVSIILHRYRSYVSRQIPGGGITWLLTGIEFESLVLAALTQGSCYRTLVVACHHSSSYLMQCLTRAADIEGSEYVTAQSMVAALQDAPSDTKKIPAVQELVSTLSIFDSILKTVNDDQAASQIVTLLEERKDDETGVCFTASSSSMHWPLLRTAKMILDKEEEDSTDSTKTIFTSAFDKRGVALLMERLTQIDTFRLETSESSPTEKEVDDMRKALGHALARAFVAENAKKKLHRKSPRRKQDAVDGILSVDLWKHHLSVQEDVVRGMLEI